jgi:hypothetical protein
MAQLSAEQQDALSKVKEPAGWAKGNSSWNPAPFPYYNSYTNPAFYDSSMQRGSGASDPFKHSNQFSSSSTQSRGRPGLPFEREHQKNSIGQSGAGFVDTVKAIHRKVKNGKYISKGLRAIGQFHPNANKYADVAHQLGYGDIMEKPIRKYKGL